MTAVVHTVFLSSAFRYALPTMNETTYFKVNISSRHEHVADQIHSLLRTSAHDESRLPEEQYDLFECCDEVVMLQVSRLDDFQTLIEYEAEGSLTPHVNLVQALTGFPGTSAQILAEHAIQ